MSHDIRLYDTASGHQKQMLRGHAGELRSLAFTQDGSRLISGGLDGTVRIWKAGQHEDGRSDWRLVSTLESNSSAINSIAVAPDGSSIAAVSHDDIMRVWRIADNEKTIINIARQLARASDHMAGNEFGEALHELDKALERSRNSLPNSLVVRELRALLFDEQGNGDLTIAEWSEALALAPNNFYLLASRAKAYAQEGKIAESTKDWHELVQLTNELNTEYLLALSQNQALMGQASEANVNLVKVLKLDSSPESFQKILAVCRLGKSIVPTGTRWKYTGTFGTAPADWNSMTFDDSDWNDGLAPFGTSLESRTEWQIESDIWLRNTFVIQEQIEKPLAFHVLIDDFAEIYLNGVLAAKVGAVDHLYKRTIVECSREARLQRGENVLAIHCHNLWSDGVIDVGLNVQADSADMLSGFTELLQQLPNGKELQVMLDNN
jgi:tetratricopeptide (TPR) repeat protein